MAWRPSWPMILTSTSAPHRRVALEGDLGEVLAPGPGPSRSTSAATRAADLRGRDGAPAPRRPRRAAARRASLTTAARHRRHPRRRRAGAGAVGEDVQVGEAGRPRPAPGCFRTSPRSRSGSRRSGRRRRRCPAARARTAAISASASARLWRRFIRFRIMSSPDCSDRCRCGHEPRLLGQAGASGPRRSRPRRSRTGAGAAAPGPASRMRRHQLAQASARPAGRRPRR